MDRSKRECGRCGLPVVWSEFGWRHVANQHTRKSCDQVAFCVERGTMLRRAAEELAAGESVMSRTPVWLTASGHYLAHGAYTLEIVQVRVKLHDDATDFSRPDWADYHHRPYMPGPVGGRVFVWSGHILAESEVEILPADAEREAWCLRELQRLATVRGDSQRRAS